MLDGKIVGVSATSEGFILAQNIPNVIIHPYEDMISAFLDLELGSIDGLIMPILQAVKINKNLFNDQFKIVSAPLTHKALRLVTLKGKNEHFIDTFNHYFRKVEIASSLKNLKQKWDLID
jgi:polar amino acid transport system substrate-binding protein